MKYEPIFILGVVGGNSSVNSTWDHFRIYGVLDKTVYKKEVIRCCLLYRDKDKIVTVQSETISERRFEVPAAMWRFHVGCPNSRHAQGKDRSAIFIFDYYLHWFTYFQKRKHVLFIPFNQFLDVKFVKDVRFSKAVIYCHKIKIN